MRILWLSRVPWAPGGYSNQTALFTPRLAAAGHEVAIVGIQGLTSGRLDWRGIPVYPLLTNDLRNTSILGLHYRHWQADLLISLHDGDKVVDGPALAKRFPELLWALWLPIDGPVLSPQTLTRVRAAAVPIVFSRFGLQVAGEHGLTARYVPHGVDTAVFAPQERAAARDRLGWPRDPFVVGMVAANEGTRKAFPQHLAGFAKFHRKYPDSRLYLHTQEVGTGGLDLSSLATNAGLKVGEDVLFCDAYRYFIGIPEEELATLYSAMDVLLLATKGEGFGIPIVEAQACGTPVVVGGWSAMPELCFSGATVRPEESAPVENGWRLADPEAIAHRLEEVYLASRDPERQAELRRAARAGALHYDADRVLAEHWLPLLADLGRSIVPPGDGRKPSLEEVTR